MKEKFVNYIDKNYFKISEKFVMQNYADDFERNHYQDYEQFIQDFCPDEFDDYVWNLFLEEGIYE